MAVFGIASASPVVGAAKAVPGGIAQVPGERQSLRVKPSNVRAAPGTGVGRTARSPFRVIGAPGIGACCRGAILNEYHGFPFAVCAVDCLNRNLD